MNFSSYTYINLLLPITSVHVLAVPVVHVPVCGVLQHVGGGHQVQGLYGDTPLAYTALATVPSLLLNTLRAIKQTNIMKEIRKFSLLTQMLLPTISL